MPVEDIKANNYNLDIKNPNTEDPSHKAPELVLAEYQKVCAELEKAQNALRDELAEALNRKVA